MVLQSRIEESYTDFTDSLVFFGKESVFSVCIRVPELYDDLDAYKVRVD